MAFLFSGLLLLALVAIAVIALMAEVPRTIRWLNGAVGILAAGLGSASLYGVVGEPVSPWVSVLWIASGVLAFALGTDPVAAPRGGSLPGAALSLGPSLTALLVSWAAGPASILRVSDPFNLALAILVGALAMLSAGFVLRALVRLGGGASAAGFSVVAAGLAGLAFRHMATLGGVANVAFMPLRGASGPARWILASGDALVVGALTEDVGITILVAATASLVAAIVPERRVSVASAGVAAAGLLAVLVALVTRHGAVVELDVTSGAILLQSLGLSDGGAVTISTVGPYRVDISQMVVPLALLTTAAGVALGVLASLLLPDPLRPPTWKQQVRARLRARDAALTGLVLAGLAVAAQSLRSQVLVGSWGPVGAADHLMVGSVVGLTGLYVAFVGLASSKGPWVRAWRSALLAAMALLIVGALTGGLVTSVGVLEL